MDIENEDDIGADIAAAFAEHNGNIPEPKEPEPRAEVEPEVKEPVDSARVRDETGKFAKAPETVQDESNTSTAPEEPEPVTTDIRPPNSWKAEAKAIFNDLPPLAREEIARRELDMQRGAQKLQQQLANYAPLDEILAPRQEKLALNGQTSATYIRALVAADDMLSNPQTGAQALAQLAQMYGIPYGQGQAPAPQSPQDPAIQTVFQKIQTLEQQLQAREQAEREATQQTYQAQIEAFQADPKNLYFEDVKPQMAVLLNSGEAQTLQEAYDQACWMKPNIRALVQADQRKAEQAAATEAARARTEAAKRASGSVVGSSGLGASVKPAVNQNNSIEDDVRLAMQSIGGRA